MTPQEALRLQIEKNERILEVVRADAIAGVTEEGRSHKEQELLKINSGLRAALELMEVYFVRQL